MTKIGDKSLGGMHEPAEVHDVAAKLLEQLTNPNVEWAVGDRKLTEAETKKILIGLLGEAGPGGIIAEEDVKSLQQALEGRAGTTLQVGDVFMQMPAQRLDVMIISGFTDILGQQAEKKDGQNAQLKKLTTELKIYSVIQSQVSAALAKKETLTISSGGMNLLNHNLYGIEAGDWEHSGVRAFLQGLSTYDGSDKLSIRQFLEGGPKETGKLNNLQDTYANEKDANPLGNFSTTLADRSRPLGDTVNEKSAMINETNARRNAVIEAFSRVVDKFDKLLKTALGY